jgi:hypothetical protein
VGNESVAKNLGKLNWDSIADLPACGCHGAFENKDIGNV